MTTAPKNFYNPPSSYSDINSTERTEQFTYPKMQPLITEMIAQNNEKNICSQPSTPQSVQNNVFPSLSCNQLNDLKTLREVLRTNSQLIVCPFCKQTAMTKTERKWSVGNLICGVTFGVGVWLVFQILRRKDLNCMDARHYCSRCGLIVNDYSAC
jgi:hypothetical protein